MGWFFSMTKNLGHRNFYAMIKYHKLLERRDRCLSMNRCKKTRVYHELLESTLESVLQKESTRELLES